MTSDRTRPSSCHLTGIAQQIQEVIQKYRVTHFLSAWLRSRPPRTSDPQSLGVFTPGGGPHRAGLEAKGTSCFIPRGVAFIRFRIVAARVGPAF